MANAQPAAVLAARTSDFLSTLGINTHIDFAAYGYQNLNVVEASINYLGVKNVRDSAESPTDAQTWLQVAQATGAKFDDYIAETSPAGMATDLSYVTQLAGEGIVNYIEGGNEEDDPYPTSLGNNLQITAQFQQQVYATGQALGIPVINMSFGSGWTAANDYQGDYGNVGDLSNVANYANAHTYPGVGQSTDWSMQRLNGLAQMAASKVPVITSEIGWDASQGFGETTLATDVLQAALDGMKDGDAKTYFYALFNDGSGEFGLMNQDGTPTLAGTALHDLTTILADIGTTAGTFTQGSLAYTLSGTAANDSTVLMEKSDGSYWLSIWDESDAAHNVTVTLGGTASDIAVYNPLTGTSAVTNTENASSITLSVSDTPLIVEIAGAGSGTTPPTSTSGGTAGSAPPPPVTPITIATKDADPVVTDSNAIITATAGNHMLFIGGTQDTAILTGGTERVQAFQGYNTITTGAGNDTISIAGSGNVVNAGAGKNTINDSGAANTIVMPVAGSGMDQIYGYVVQNGDFFDFTAALAATQWDGSQQTIASFLHIATSGNDAIFSTSVTANGARGQIADLHDSGAVSMATLLSQSIV